MHRPHRAALIIRLTHTGQFGNGRPNKGPVRLTDVDVGYEAQDRKVPAYVPYGSTVDINASSRTMLSFEQGVIAKFTNAGILTSKMFYVPESYVTAELPPASQYPEGVHVWDTEKNTAVWSDGTKWVTAATIINLGETPLPLPPGGEPHTDIEAAVPVAIQGPDIIPADAGDPSKTPVAGFYTGPETNRIRTSGLVENVAGVSWTPGADLYLAVGGGFTHTPPTGSGKVSQYLGQAVSPNSFFANIGPAISL